MSLTVLDIYRGLGCDYFFEVCKRVDKNFGQGTNFDILTVIKKNGMVLVIVKTEMGKKLKLVL